MRNPAPALLHILLGIAALTAAACGGSAASGGGPVTYRTVKVAQETLAVSIEAVGTLQPAQQVEVGSRVGGQVARVLVDYNDSVKAGQLLAEIDAAPLRAQRDAARGSVEGARAELARARADLALKEQTAARAQDLRARGLNAPADVEAAVGARDVAHAQVDVAAAGLVRTQASLAQADSDLAATRILAPIDGVVLARAVDAGQTVAASFQTPRLFVIAGTLENLEVVAKVDEADLAVVAAGAEGTVKVDAYPGLTFTARVRQVRVDPTTENGVVTFPVVLTVDNPDKKLLPGMTSTVTIAGPPVENARVVPAAALRYVPSTSDDAIARDTGARVFVLVDGAPKPVRVRVGVKAAGKVQVDAAELQVGADVVVDDTGSGAKGKSSGGRGPPRIF